MLCNIIFVLQRTILMQSMAIGHYTSSEKNNLDLTLRLIRLFKHTKILKPILSRQEPSKSNQSTTLALQPVGQHSGIPYLFIFCR